MVFFLSVKIGKKDGIWMGFNIVVLDFQSATRKVIYLVIVVRLVKIIQDSTLSRILYSLNYIHYKKQFLSQLQFFDHFPSILISRIKHQRFFISFNRFIFLPQFHQTFSITIKCIESIRI